MNATLRLFPLAISAFLFICTASLTQAASLTDFNLVVFGDLDSTSEVEGKAFIGGNLSGSASNYGVSLSLASDDVALAVGGSITAGNVSVNAGAMSVVGDVDGNVNMNSNGDYVVGGTINGQVNNGTEVSSLDVPTLSEIQSFYLALSNSYSSLTPNSTFEIENGFRALYAADPSIVGELAVIEVTAAEGLELPSTVSQLAVDLDNASGMIINVTGETIEIPSSLNPVGEILNDAVRERVVWNFVNATSLNINPNFNGMVLAPFASLQNSTAIDGQVIVDSFTQRGEVHLPISVIGVPEPSTLLVVVLVLGLSAPRLLPRGC